MIDSAMNEALRERAKDDCIEYGTPSRGVDHSNHWKPVPYPTPAVLVLVKLPPMRKEKSNESN